MEPEQLIDQYRVARSIQYRHNLEVFETSALHAVQRKVEAARKEITSRLSREAGSMAAFERSHMEGVLRELDSLSDGIIQTIGSDLTSMAAVSGSSGLNEAYQSLSLGGIAPNVSNVALSPEQFRSFLMTSPYQGLLIPQWVAVAYGNTVRNSIHESMLGSLQQGALMGESYAKMVDRLQDGFSDFSRKELTTLARTFVQDANVRAHRTVMEANRDVVDGWIWTVANDDRICLDCLGLSENFYGLNEPHPPMPLHPRCRCFPRTKTKSFRELGLDIDELEPIERAVVTRGYEDPKTGKWVVPPVDTGGARIQSVAFHPDGVRGAFPSMPDSQKLKLLGRRRFELFKDGHLSFDELVDPITGKRVLLREMPMSAPAKARVSSVAKRVQKGLLGQQEAAQWLSSFQNSPDWIQDVVSRVQTPDLVLKKNSFFYKGGGYKIEMDPDAIARFSQRMQHSALRHEYGHYLDNVLGGAKARWFSAENKSLVAAMNADRDFIALNSRGAAANKRYVDRYMETLQGARAAGNMDEFFSARIKTLGFDERDFYTMLSKDGLGNFGAGAAKRSAVIASLETGNSRQFLRSIRAWDAQELNRTITPNVSDFFGSVTYNPGMKVADLNARRVGWGHRDSYYKANKYARGSESFANMFALQTADTAGGWRVAMRHLSPEYTRTFESVLRSKDLMIPAARLGTGPVRGVTMQAWKPGVATTPGKVPKLKGAPATAGERAFEKLDKVAQARWFDLYMAEGKAVLGAKDHRQAFDIALSSRKLSSRMERFIKRYWR